MTLMRCTVILVYSTSYALHIERILGQASVSCSLIPVPRHLSSDCGVCVRIGSENKVKVEKILEKEKIPFEGIFDLKEE
jgi:SH3-like domain-containing protein